MHKVSLIVATLGQRPDDLSVLLFSLIPQVEYIHEVIIVDQHPDRQFLLALLNRFSDSLPIVYTRSERGLSVARNHGLSLATGSLVAFPDDDCLYTNGLLEWVVNWLQSHVEYDILAVGAKDVESIDSGNRWPQSMCDIRPVNAFRTTFSSTLFLWTDLAKTTQFDTQLGVGSGTAYGSGEETDYILRLLRTGARGRFDRTRHVVHPRRDMLSGTGSFERAQAYGSGMGHLLRKHALGVLWASFLTYNLGRSGLSLIRGNTLGSQLCMAQTKGLWHGFLESVPQPSAANASPSATSAAQSSMFTQAVKLANTEPGGASTL